MSTLFIYVLFSSMLEFRCVHSYYHLDPLERSYFFVGYLPDIVELLPIRVAGRREDDVGVLSADEVFGGSIDLESLRPCMECCGSRKSDSPVKSL